MELDARVMELENVGLECNTTSIKISIGLTISMSLLLIEITKLLPQQFLQFTLEQKYIHFVCIHP